MSFAFGDIYYVEFDPSVGHEYQGKRPAFIAMEESISKVSNLITVLPITSRVDKMYLFDVFIQKDGKNKLLTDSVIRANHISTFDKERCLFKIGAVGSPVIRQVRGYLRRHFGM